MFVLFATATFIGAYVEHGFGDVSNAWFSSGALVLLGLAFVAVHLLWKYCDEGSHIRGG